MIEPSIDSPARTRILQTALGLFAKEGFDRVSTRDIGKAGGLTSPALYRHYPTKDALGLDLYRRCYAQMVDAALRAGDEPNAIAKLAGYVVRQLELFDRSPLVMLYVDEHQQRFWPQIKAEFEPDTLTGCVKRWLDEGRTDGTIRRDISANIQAALVLGLTSQWVAMRRQSLVADDPDATEQIAGLVRHALAKD